MRLILLLGVPFYGLQQNIVTQDGLKAGHQPSLAQRPPVIPTVGVQASA
jgi:hypothetical protein